MSDLLDPRTGLPFAPSASGMFRFLNCRGSWKMELPYIMAGEVEENSPESESGICIHKWLELHEVGKHSEQELTDDELEMAEKCLEQQAQIVVDNAPFTQLFTEQRLTLWKGFRLLLSGQMDVMVRAWKKLVIIDYKTGFDRVKPNCDQLKSLAMLAIANLPASEEIEEVELWIVQPFFGKPQKYTMRIAEIEEYYQSIIDPLDNAGNYDDLSPSYESCKHCRAKAHCHAVYEQVLDMELVSDSIELENLSQSLATPTLAEMYRKLPLVKKIIEAIEEAVFEKLCNGEAVEGLEIKIDTPRLGEVENVWMRQWLTMNNHIGKSGRANKGTVALAKSAWDKASKKLVKTTTYDKRSWIDSRLALHALEASLTHQQLLRVAGKIVEVESK